CSGAGPAFRMIVNYIASQYWTCLDFAVYLVFGRVGRS
ncbi:MAG: hypothetical protein EZS28_018445, partial [Streblomastix strix]